MTLYWSLFVNKTDTFSEHCCQTRYSLFHGLGLWCLTPLSTIFQLYIVAVSFIGGGNRSTRRKLLTCASHWQTLSHNVPPWARFEPTTLVVVIGTDYADRSNYHTTTRLPPRFHVHRYKDISVWMTSKVMPTTPLQIGITGQEI